VRAIAFFTHAQLTRARFTLRVLAALLVLEKGLILCGFEPQTVRPVVRALDWPSFSL